MKKMSQYLNKELSKMSRYVTDNDGAIVFSRSTAKDNIAIKVVFEDYIVHPFEGFDFHAKWNNNIPPYNKIMYGKISKETEKMYYFEVQSDTSDRAWCGWCPKKSCHVFNI